MPPFLILHGLEGSGPGHWQTWLAERLRARGERVSYPDLPEPFDPQPEAWREAVEAELDGLDEPVVLCHSLACLLWLRLARDVEARRAERVLLVAPPRLPDLAPVARFGPDGVAPADVRRAAGETLLVCSDNDPYCPPGAVAAYAEPLEIPAHVISGAGHINTDAGYGEWPAVEQWTFGDGFVFPQ
jgi:predicted alpha/beta hydrolase family esterase